MSRILWGGTLLLAITLDIQPTAGQSAGELQRERGQFAQQTANLQQELESKLKARRTAEFAFIARVVTRVESGDVPLSLVRTLVRWARRKHPDYPFPYFQRGLRTVATQLGLNL